MWLPDTFPGVRYPRLQGNPGPRRAETRGTIPIHGQLSCLQHPHHGSIPSATTATLLPHGFVSDHFWIQPLQLSATPQNPRSSPGPGKGHSPGSGQLKGFIWDVSEGARTRLGLIPARGAGSESSNPQAQVSVQGCAHRDGDTATSTYPGMCTPAGSSFPGSTPLISQTLGFSPFSRSTRISPIPIPLPGSPAGGGTLQVYPCPAKLSSARQTHVSQWSL